MITSSDTIVARATPLGTAGIAIVRLSGPAAFAIAAEFFVPSGPLSFSDLSPRYLAGGVITEGGEILDQCLAVKFHGPNSFTGEDVVEFHLHGNMLIVDHVVGLCVRRGARMATPGEFTKRAFLHGKIDLTQVEALADVLASESEQALFVAQRQLHGELRRKLGELRERLLKVLALLELELDFVQDGYHFASLDQVNALLQELREFVDRLLGSYQAGNRLRQGPRVLLLGRPNAGKSSLFNALVGYSRALVSPLEGTTRDYMEERVAYGGVQFRIVDTAGLRQTGDTIEAEGVARAYDLIAVADHILYLIDGTRPDGLQQELEHLEDLRREFPAVVISPVLTKSDLSTPFRSDILSCSVVRLESIRSLLEHLVAHFSIDVSEAVALVNERQYHLLLVIRDLLDGIRYQATDETELLAADLRMLLTPMAELSGEIVNDDVLNTLFSSFCIGK